MTPGLSSTAEPRASAVAVRVAHVPAPPPPPRLADDPDGATLARDGGRAFVSQSLRAYVVAALADAAAAGPPALVVAGDDRQARDLAADLRQWLRPRPVRFYPSRGVAYESHLAPPPHLVGLRVAALDALIDAEGRARRPGARPSRPSRRSSSCRPWRSARRSPTPRCARTPSRCARATSSTSTRSSATSSPPATSASTRSTTAASSPSAAASSTSTRRRRTAPSAWTSSTSRSSRCARSRPSPSARWATSTRSRSRPPPSSPPSTASWPRSPRSRTPTSARTSRELLPVDRFHAFLDLAPRDAEVIIAAEEEVAPALADHWQDVCAAFHDEDAHHLYVKPETITAAARRARPHPPVVDLRRPAAASSARRPPTSPRARCKRRRARAREARALGLPHGRRLAAARRRRARRLQPRPPARPWLNGAPAPPASCASPRPACATASSPPGLRLAVHPRAPPLPPPPRGAEPAAAGRRRGALRSFADLRTGDIVVHEDHGVARFAGFETKTVAGVMRDYLRARVRRHGQGLHARWTSWRRSAATSAPAAAHPPLCKLGGKSWETLKARARRAAQELAGELLNLYAERTPAPGPRLPRGLGVAARVRGALPLAGDGRPARGDRARQGRHGARAADGPPHLRRRGLRQDRGRPARRLQGGRRRQAGARAGADDDPRPAAPRDVRRAPEGLPVHRSTTSAASAAPRSSARPSPPSTAARSTSSSAPTGCWAATCARRTSGCSSSTRSSASASSRRSCCASSSCASTSSP